MGVPITTTIPTPLADGVYAYDIPVQPGLPPAAQVHLVGKVGTGNWGPVNQPVFYNTLGQAIYWWGDAANLLSGPTSGSLYNLSLVAATQVMVPECQQHCDIRVTDGTDTASTIPYKDNLGSATIFTAAALYTGTDGNYLTFAINLLSGSYTSSGGIPMVQAVVAFNGTIGGAGLANNRQPWVSPPFAAGTNASGYVAATFRANLKAVMGGTFNGSGPCPYATYVSDGASSAKPGVTNAQQQFGNGGSSGTAFILNNPGSVNQISNALIGVQGTGAPPGSAGGSTGMYAFQGTGINLLLFCGWWETTTNSVATNMATFAQANSCVALSSFASGTTTTNAISYRQTVNAISPWLVLCNDWTLVNDVVDTGAQQYNPPHEKVAAIISQLNPYQYPGNKPYIGAQNFLGTIRNGLPYSNSELGQLEQNGILIVTNPIPRGNVWGLAHGMTSDGVTPISDSRMLNLIANEVTDILGQFVGEVQTPPPLPGQQDTDKTRRAARDAVAAYLSTLSNPNAPQIAAWTQIMDGTNNTQATVAAGYLYDKILVTTLAGIRFILVGLSIGENVQVTTAQ